MTFEDDFPRLKGTQWYFQQAALLQNHFVPGEGHGPGTTFYTQQDVQNVCLDKQRVREAIIKCTDITGQLHGHQADLFEELGLDE